MTTTSPSPGQPSLTIPSVRRRSGPGRILFGYVTVLVAAALGVVGLPVALLGMEQCTAEGFDCLGWLFIGAGVGAAVGVAALFVCARLTRLGWPFALVAVLLLAAAAALPGEAWLRILAAALVPLVAAQVTSPRTTGSSAGRHRRVVVGVVGVLVLVLVLLAALVVQTVSTVDHRTDLYAEQGVHPVGLPDDRGWTYVTVIESPTAVRGFTYRMEDGSGTEVRVDVEERGASAYDPPADCSSDPHATAPCRELAPGVWADANVDTVRVITTDETAVSVQRVDGSMTDDELTELAGRMGPQSYRWLATRDCRLCRLR